MRRDLCYFYPVDVCTLYNVYLTAASNPPFDKTCKQTPYHTISFGLNYSLKYNMNGGACTLHFIPWQNGSAINMRFSIVQSLGARYKAYAEDLNNCVAKLLGIPGKETAIDVELFLDPRNQVAIAPGMMPPPPAQPVPVAQPMAARQQPYPPVQQSAFPQAQPPAPKINFCPQCGAPVQGVANFCNKCGKDLR